MNKIIVSLVLLMLVSTSVDAVKVKHAELDESYSFDRYVKDYNLKYVTAKEYSYRKSLFESELARVIKHNKQNLSWKEGINRFSALTKEEARKQSTGRHKGVSANHTPKHVSTISRDEYKLNSIDSLPTSIDWRDANIVTPVKDQGYCGSCWAFAATSVLESAVAKAHGLLYEFSPEQLAMCTPNPLACGGTGGCEGGTAELIFDYIPTSPGLYEEFQYPYVSYFGVDQNCTANAANPKASISGYVKLIENSYLDLMNAVATVGPIAVSVDASFGAYESGIYSGCPTGNDGSNINIDHAVVLVGYGEEDGTKYWIVRNSWSPDWGEKGYIRLLRTDADAETCGTDSTPADGTACAGQTESVTCCGQCGILYDSAYATGAYLL